MKPLSLVLRLPFLALFILSVFSTFTFGSDTTARPVARSSLPPVFLPKQFGGWRVADSIVSRIDPTAADQVNAGVLKEYGFVELETTTYVRTDGRQLSLKAARFE